MVTCVWFVVFGLVCGCFEVRLLFMLFCFGHVGLFCDVLFGLGGVGGYAVWVCVLFGYWLFVG